MNKKDYLMIKFHLTLIRSGRRVVVVKMKFVVYITSFSLMFHLQKQMETKNKKSLRLLGHQFCIGH